MVSRENVESGRKKIDVHIATAADLEDLTTTLTAAFEHDPLWTWVFPNPKHLAVWWRFCISSALRYSCVWITGDYAAASVWIPPEGTELSPRAPEALELLERFETSHPRLRPHYYLSLLGTHPDHRGQGLGMSLLTENLRGMDAEGIPAYLESSNPRNDGPYEEIGFRRLGEFDTPGGERKVTTLWRDAGGGQTIGL